MPAKDYDDLNRMQQQDRLEMLGKSVGVSRKNHRPASWIGESVAYRGRPSDHERMSNESFERDVIRAINNDYDYRTAMQYTEGAPKAVNTASEALDVYRTLKRAHKDAGNTGNFSSANDFGNAAQNIFEQNRSDFADSISSKKDKPKKDKAPKTAPAKTVLSKKAAEANAFVDAHNAMTLGNASPLQGMAVSNKAGTSSPKAAAFKENFQLNLGGASTPLSFTEAITGTKPTIAAPFMKLYKDNIKGQLEPK